MNAATADLLKMGLSFVAASSFVVGWIHLSAQPEFSRSIGRSVAVVIRTLLLYCSAWGIACWGMKFPANEVAVVAALLTILLPRISHQTRLEEPGVFTSTLGGDQFGGGCFFAAWMMLLLPLMLLREFVFGDSISGVGGGDAGTPAVAKCVSSERIEFQEKMATVVSPLKPSGMIEVADQTLAAYSATGAYIMSGTQVRVCGERHGMLAVRVVNE